VVEYLSDFLAGLSEEGTVPVQREPRLGESQDQGFTLIELLIVILIVGVLAAVATPLYLGYVKDAKTAEAKTVVGSLWTSVLNNATANCGVPSPVSAGYSKAGLTSTGATTPARWSVPSGAATLTVDCVSGAFSLSLSTLFTLTGTTTDVNFVQVQFVYSSTGTPPSKLQCSTDGGATFVDC
jgi:type IV pilus assembly protein PilA